MTAVYLRKLNIGVDRTPTELTAYRSAEVRRLLADCLTERYGKAAADWSLAKTEEGKPYLVMAQGANQGAPQISLSHSGAWVVCALSDAPVGVDVQQVRSISDAVMRRFLPDVKHHTDDRGKTLAWTRYEACLKRYGSRTAMVSDAAGQCYDSRELDDAVVTVCHGDDEVEWEISR